MLYLNLNNIIFSSIFFKKFLHMYIYIYIYGYAFNTYPLLNFFKIPFMRFYTLSLPRIRFHFHVTQWKNTLSTILTWKRDHFNYIWISYNKQTKYLNLIIVFVGLDDRDEPLNVGFCFLTVERKQKSESFLFNNSFQ